ncbi:MAG: hypothetical protein V4635_09485 [Bacteroidota bacterium]
MSKIIDRETNNWYQEVAAQDFYKEIDLEREIMHNISVIFPEYIPASFKVELTHNVTGKKNKADLCMIKFDYTEWYVIEVELGGHSEAEVIKQIDTFANCTYTAAHASHIHNQNNTLNLTSLTVLVTGKNPELMVIVNEEKKEWKKGLKKYSCKMCVFQIYNDFGGRKIFRLQGEHPFIYTNFRNCTFEKSLPFAIKILNEEGFLSSYNISNGDSVDIEFNGVRNVWVREDYGSEVFLTCKSPTAPLDSLTSRYRLNYYKTRRVSQPTGNTIKIRLLNWLNKSQVQINNSFSFTKE